MTVTARILGDSVGVGYNASDAAHRWATLVCAQYGWTQDNQGLPSSGVAEAGGFKASNGEGQMGGGITAAFSGATVDANSRTLWISNYNDMRYFGNNANAIETNRRAMRAILAWRTRIHVDKKQAITSWSKTGSWTNLTLPFGLTAEIESAYGSTIGNTASVSVSGTAVTLVYMARLGDGGKFTVTIDGNSVGSQIDTAFGSVTGWTPATGFIPMAIRYTGLSAGAHTIQITQSASGVVQMLFAVGSGESVHPAVYVTGPLLMADYTAFSPYNQGSDAAVAAFYQMVQDVVAEVVADGGRAFTFDINAYYNKAHVDADTVHPTDTGHAEIANGFIARIESSHSSVGWYDPAWTKRIPVTLDNTNAPFALSNHQIEIDLSASAYAALIAAANADGSDILVTDTDGTTLLNFWLKSYLPGSSTGTIVVTIPSLAIGATKAIYVYYGNAAQTTSLGSRANTLTRTTIASGVSAKYLLDDNTGSTLAEASAGTAAAVLGTGGTGSTPTWEAQDSGYVDICDNEDAARFALTGAGWTRDVVSVEGYGIAEHYSASGAGSDVATWTFSNLPPGNYKVMATWKEAANRATNAPYKVYDNATLKTTIAINQVNAPNDLTANNGTWETLSASVAILSGTLKVTLTDNANGFVLADAIRIENLDAWNGGFSGDYCVKLNGTNQGIKLPGFKNNTPASGAIMFWFRNYNSPIATNAMLLGMKANATGGGTGNMLEIYFASSKWNLFTSVGGTGVTTSGIKTNWPAGQWHHFCYTWNVSQREVWIDGVLDICQTTGGNGSVGLFNGVSATNEMSIGALHQFDAGLSEYSTTPQYNFKAAFDQITVLDHQASPGEIIADRDRIKHGAGRVQHDRWTKGGVLVSPPAWSGGQHGRANRASGSLRGRHASANGYWRPLQRLQ